MAYHPHDHSTYRGFRIAYYGAVDERTGQQHNLYFVRGWIGVWNSNKWHLI